MKLKRLFSMLLAACTIGLLTSVFTFTPVAAASIGSIVCNPSSGAPGQTINVTGTVSGALTSYGYIGFDSQTNVVGSVTITSTYFSGSFVVPTTASTGVHYLYVIIDGTPGSTTFTVAANFTLGASTGSVGDTVTVTGNGFSPNTAVPFYWDSGTTPFTTITSTAGGAISGNITIPAGARGAHTISSTAGTTPQTFTILSKLSINPVTGGSGISVAVTGTGFAASTTIIIAWDGTSVTTSPSTVTSSTTGSFSCTFIVPASYRGDHTIRASDPGGFAVVNFPVTQNITLSAATAKTGDTMVITGNSFASNQNITFTLDGASLTTTPSSVVSGSDGSFINVSFTVPALSGGTHTVRATDQSGNYAEKTFTITASIAVVSPAPVGQNPAKGPVGTQITVEGNGFTPGSTVAIQWDNAAMSPAVTTTASSTGTISVSFKAPASKYGDHSIKAAEGSNSATATFGITAGIALSPATGGYGDTVTATFTGFGAGNTITLQIKAGTKTYDILTSPAAVTADANGSASATFVIPAVAAGNWTIEAQGPTTQISASAILAVTPKLTLGAATGSVGDTVSIIGTGFGASRSITFTYGGTALSTSSTSDANGSFTYQFTVPETAAGNITIQASDGTNVTSTTFAATATASASATTTQSNPGHVGMDVTVSGKGFKANATITVTFESTPVTVATVTSSAGGSFTATFKVPAAAAGQHTIKATDGTTTKEFAFFMDSTAPGAPALKTPITAKKAKQPVAFTWDAASDPSGITYTLQVSQDATFSTCIIEKTGLTDTSYTMTEAEKLKSSGSKTPYYWRVLAVDGAGNVGAWSTANTFTIGFIWPTWMVHVWYGIGIVVALILGLWLGRRMAYQSY